MAITKISRYSTLDHPALDELVAEYDVLVMQVIAMAYIVMAESLSLNTTCL